MSEVASLIDEIETALSAGTPRQRRDVLTRVTDLFITGSSGYSHEQIALFDEILLLLTAEIEEKARAQLSQRLAKVGNAPRRVIVSLAADDSVAVAAPVLKSSPQLSDEDLIATASTNAGRWVAPLRRNDSDNLFCSLVLGAFSAARQMLSRTAPAGSRRAACRRCRAPAA
jgi:uncharacterized protein (DUF2336 family)